MKLATAATMLVVVGIVWGGFLTALVTAMRKEAQKFRNRDKEAPES